MTIGTLNSLSARYIQKFQFPTLEKWQFAFMFLLTFFLMACTSNLKKEVQIINNPGKVLDEAPRGVYEKSLPIHPTKKRRPWNRMLESHIMESVTISGQESIAKTCRSRRPDNTLHKTVILFQRPNKF